MQQLDLFDKDPQFFLYGEIEKVKTSLDKQRKAFFALLSEMQSEIIKLKEKNRE